MLCYFLLISGLFILSFTEKVEDALCFGTLKLDLPVRYLHIQLRYGEMNVTESIGPLKISILGSCRHRLVFHWNKLCFLELSLKILFLLSTTFAIILLKMLWSIVDSSYLTIMTVHMCYDYDYGLLVYRWL